MRDMAPSSASYDATRHRVASYFDGTATRVWERLTSDAPVSRVRQTVREGRDTMRALMLAQMPEDLRGARCWMRAAARARQAPNWPRAGPMWWR